MKKLLLLFFAIFSFYVFQLEMVLAKTKKLKSSPSVEKILKEKDSGILHIRLKSNMTNYKIFLHSFDPSTGQITDEKTIYRLKVSDNGLLGNKRERNPEYQDYFFLIEGGTFIFRSVEFAVYDRYHVCFLRTFVFDVQPQRVNHIGEFSLMSNKFASKSEKSLYPDLLAFHYEGKKFEEVNKAVVQTYSGSDFPLVESEVQKEVLPINCRSYKSTVVVR